MNFGAFEHVLPIRPPAECVAGSNLYGQYLAPGFSPSSDDDNKQLMDLNELCVKHPSATYYVRASGDSMKDAGIYDGDMLVLDRSVRAECGNIVVAVLNGDFTVRVMSTKNGLQLEPRNSEYSSMEITDSDEFEIFGVVTFVIHATL